MLRTAFGCAAGWQKAKAGVLLLQARLRAASSVRATIEHKKVRMDGGSDDLSNR
jgi:hypothetical protein